MKTISEILKGSRYSNYREIVNKRKEKIEDPMNKYNIPLLQDTESLVDGFSSDRTGYDTGSELENKYQK